MALINLPGDYWIDIPAEGYAIDFGHEREVLERKISPQRVVEILREADINYGDDALTYSTKESDNA